MENLKQFFFRHRRILVALLHWSAIVGCNFFAFWVRFDGRIPPEQLRLFQSTLLWLLAIRSLLFIPFRLYEGLWRYTGIWDLRNIILSVGSSSLAFALFTYGLLKATAYPWSVMVIDALTLTSCLGGIRLARRIYRALNHHQHGKKVLIFGAGDAGEMIVRDMKNNGFYNYGPIGFIDDDTSKVGQSIHGVRVLGTRKALSQIFSTHAPAEVLVAMPKVGPSKIREVVSSLQPFNVPIKILPNLKDVLEGRVSVNQIRNLQVEDLLDRAPIDLRAESARDLIEGKSVLVTGAGGSIGSELCRQIATLNPASLILCERYENNLYAIQNNLIDNDFSAKKLHPVIADVTDKLRIHSVFGNFRPQLVFHAAAHKHVPLMESHPCEAVKNNVLGTLVVAEACRTWGTERFIFISSDKAVNPTSVMGATKRIAELLTYDMNQNGQTIFACVRFGNVLESNGSVVPRFIEQIKAGGPVTVTHPEIKRYFMLISEAVHLVLYAASLAQTGEIFVLEMGEQIRVLEMARNLIRLAGFVPDKDIPIEFIGLRPGEKLYEELVGSDETIEHSPTDNIFRVKSSAVPDFFLLNQKIAELIRKATQGDSEATVQILKKIIPTFQPSVSSQRLARNQQVQEHISDLSLVNNAI